MAKLPLKKESTGCAVVQYVTTALVDCHVVSKLLLCRHRRLVYVRRWSAPPVSILTERARKRARVNMIELESLQGMGYGMGGSLHSDTNAGILTLYILQTVSVKSFHHMYRQKKRP